MNLKKWSNYVRQVARVLYSNPLVHLLVDFVVEHQEVEKLTFAFLHKIESEERNIQTALNTLNKHGIFQMIEEKLDKFKLDCQEKYNMAPEQLKHEKKPFKYFFNVDLKFILKARLHLLKKEFDQSSSSNKHAHGLKYRCDKCELGRAPDAVRSEVDANADNFLCKYCKEKLIEDVQENKLNEEEQQICRDTIQKLHNNLQMFDSYVIPANFFGPGKLQAYSGLGNQQELEDKANVNFVIEPGCSEYLGPVMCKRCNKEEMEQLKTNKDLQPFVDFYFNLEMKQLKRRKLN